MPNTEKDVPTLREAAVRAVVENLGLIWPDEAEPMHAEVADAVLALCVIPPGSTAPAFRVGDDTEEGT